MPSLLLMRKRGAAALIAALGGNASVPAIYDVRSGLTTSGGFVDSWADARGAGFGPTLSQSDNTRKPAWDGTVVTFDGVDDNLFSAASSLFDLAGAYSIVLVGAVRETAGGAFAGGIGDTGALARALLFRQSATSAGVNMVDFRGGGFSAVASSTATVGLTRRVVAVSKNASTGLSVDVPSVARVSNTAGGSVAAGNNVLTIGSSFNGAANPGQPLVRAVFTLARQVTAGDLAAILAWAQANHGAVAA